MSKRKSPPRSDEHINSVYAAVESWRRRYATDDDVTIIMIANACGISDSYCRKIVGGLLFVASPGKAARARSRVISKKSLAIHAAVDSFRVAFETGEMDFKEIASKAHCHPDTVSYRARSNRWKKPHGKPMKDLVNQNWSPPIRYPSIWAYAQGVAL